MLRARKEMQWENAVKWVEWLQRDDTGQILLQRESQGKDKWAVVFWIKGTGDTKVLGGKIVVGLKSIWKRDG